MNHVILNSDRCYHVLKKIADYLGTSVDNYGKCLYVRHLVMFFTVTSKHKDGLDDDDDMIALWKHVSDFSRSIEINYKTKDNNEILTRVYFPFDPAVSTWMYR